MTSFALYRLPHEQQCTLVEQTEGVPRELPGCASLDALSGFVLAPFHVSDRDALLLIRPDRVCVMEVDGLLSHPEGAALESWMARHLVQTAGQSSSTCHEYASSFDVFHQSLVNQTYRKLVLARCVFEAAVGSPSPLLLFQKACRMYPRLFIALIGTPQSGLWLVATPEILLASDDDCHWRTIALAGTMRLSDDELEGEGQHLNWSVKNIEEQRLVATYIGQCLEHFASDVSEEGPRTVRAANLVHLRSDFTFTMTDGVARVGRLLEALHPTPAVCGLPKQQAMQFILQNEHLSRSYYSGFMGPLHLSPLRTGKSSTHLYVTLRCMQLFANGYQLYAGGGLLKDSVKELEWQETEAKMETMRRLLHSSLT